MTQVNSIFIKTTNPESLKAAEVFLRDKKELMVLRPEENATTALVLAGPKKSAVYREYAAQREERYPNFMDWMRTVSPKVREEADKVLNGLKYALGKKYFELEKGSKTVEATPENLQNMHKFMREA